MIELGLTVVQMALGLVGLTILAVLGLLAFIVVFGGLAKVFGLDKPKIANKGGQR